MERTFGTLPKAPVPTLWIAGLAYVLAASMVYWVMLLWSNRATDCAGPEVTEYVNITLHALLILGSTAYVAIYRRRIGIVAAPVVVVALLVGLFMLDAEGRSTFGLSPDDPYAGICLRF